RRNSLLLIEVTEARQNVPFGNPASLANEHFNDDALGFCTNGHFAARQNFEVRRNLQFPTSDECNHERCSNYSQISILPERCPSDYSAQARKRFDGCPL